MKLVKAEKIGMPAQDQSVWDFDIPENGVYVISISARCKNWLQNYKRLFNDDDLAIQIDDYLFFEIKGKKREFASSGSWNGNEIKGNTKDVLFLLPLKADAHKIKFWVDGQPILEEIKIYKINENEIDLIASNAVTPDKFLDVIFKNLKIEKLGIKAKAGTDSKLEIKIDGKTEKNPKYKRFSKWYWYGQELKGNSKGYNISDGLDDELHSLEFKGQGKPEIESFKLKIDLENIVYNSGFVRLYKDLIIRDNVNLRSDHTDESESLAMLRDGERVDILSERIEGKYIENLSRIWHEVTVQNIKGYVLSTYIEIEGQERKKIVDLIKEKCRQYDVDANIMLAIAGKESHFKPFAESYKGSLGIFQLSADTRDRFQVKDPYDFYQNVEGGVQNYKDIEKRITGRGDILVKRLAAWHDGLTVTIRKINNKTFDFNQLSDKTKTFIQTVLANLEKKDWYHIIYLPIVILFFASSLYINNTSEKIIAQSVAANVISYDFDSLMHYSSKTNSHNNTSNFSSVFDDHKYDPVDYYSYFPNVFLNETKNQVIFLNSKKKIAGELNIEKLNIDQILGIADVVIPDWPNNTHISPVVLENPENVFYFSATDTNGCGASNCTWVFYRFSAEKNELKVINADIFGTVTGTYLSPDLKYIAISSISHGGICYGSESLDIFNNITFAHEEVNWPDEYIYTSQIIEDIVWENTNEIKFSASYFKCPELDERKINLLYNIYNQKATILNNEIIYHEAG